MSVVDVEANVVATFGTPVYLYDLDDVRRAHAALRRALPQPSALYYSLKANPHPAIVAALAWLGCRAEVSSVGEIEAALDAGIPAADLLLTGPGKTRELLAWALTRGVRRVSVDSPVDLARVGAVGEETGCEVDCLLRVNADRPVPSMGLSMTGTASQFGADASWVLAQPERFRGSGSARVTGLHLYMGTNIEDHEVLTRQLATSVELAGTLRTVLYPGLREVDLGSGFAMPFARSGARPDYTGLSDRLERLLDAKLPGWRDGAPLLSFESGRYLAGGCGTLVCRVVDVKISKGRTFVVLDSGVHHLGGMSGLRRLPRIRPELVPAGIAAGVRRGGAVVEDCVIAGPLCTPLDIWCDGAELTALEVGDSVAVPNVGAYGLTSSLVAFLGHPLAAEVVVEGGEVISGSRLVLRRKSLPMRRQTWTSGSPRSYATT